MSCTKLSESDWQRRVMDYARLCQWRVFHIADSRRVTANKVIGDVGVRGLPDLILIRPPRLVFAELKSAKGRVRPAQTEVLDLLNQCPGVEIYLWRPDDWEQVLEVLK